MDPEQVIVIDEGFRPDLLLIHPSRGATRQKQELNGLQQERPATEARSVLSTQRRLNL